MAKKVSLCVAPNKNFLETQTVIKLPVDGREGVEARVVGCSVLLAATIANSSIKLWNDPVSLLEYLVEFDVISTFNGNQFDFVIIASDVARAYRNNNESEGLVVQSPEFLNVYTTLLTKSYDIAALLKNKTNEVLKLSNLSATTLKTARSYQFSDAALALRSNDFFTLSNFVLEGAVLSYDLHQVAEQLKVLLYTAVDGTIQKVEL